MSFPQLDWLTAQWGAVLGASLLAAATDLKDRRIPNWLTAPVALGGLLHAALAGGVATFGSHPGASVLLALPFVLLFLMAGGGAGDAKMMGAIGAWLGLSDGTVTLVSVVIAGGVLAVLWTLIRREGRTVLNNLLIMAYGLSALACGRQKLTDAGSVMPPTAGMRKMPYGVAILLGVCIAAPLCAHG